MIDDDTDDQKIFALALEDLDFPVDCHYAQDGSKIIEQLKNESGLTPDFIFIDLNMPCMNGRQCLSEIRKIPRLMHTPVIIYSTSSQQKDIDETRALGATAYISKPTKISVLRKKLEELF